MINVYLAKGLVMYDDRYLLLRKRKDVVFESTGKWETPGGKIKECEDSKEAILREISEETGLSCEIITELPFLEMKTKKVEAKCHVFLLNAESENVTLSEEHTEYMWIRPQDVKRMKLVLFADLLLEYLNHAQKYLTKVS